MRNIKYFKYKNTLAFEKFLKEYNYKINGVDGFSYIGQKQYHGNIFKVYSIWFKDYGEQYFTIVYFKSFNECNRSRLGFNGEKLLS